MSKIAARLKRIERNLTDANERAKVLSDLATTEIRASIEAARLKYMGALADITEKLERLPDGTLLQSAQNKALLNQIEVLGQQYTEYVAAIAKSPQVKQLFARAIIDAGDVLDGIARSTKLASITKADIMALVEARTDRLTPGLRSLARNTSESAAGIVREAIDNFTGDDGQLNARLFGSDSLEYFRKRNAELSAKAESMRANLNSIINRTVDDSALVAARDKSRDDLAAYIEKRKAWIEEQKAKGLDPKVSGETIESRSILDVKKEIMDTHQDAIHRYTTATYGDPGKVLYVNAKNTSYPDNCIDAMNAEPMTLAQWKASPTGLPRSTRRDCGQFCQCLVFPVGTSDEAAELEDLTGAEISDQATVTP